MDTVTVRTPPCEVVWALPVTLAELLWVSEEDVSKRIELAAIEVSEEVAVCTSTQS